MVVLSHRRNLDIVYKYQAIFLISDLIYVSSFPHSREEDFTIYHDV